MKQKTRPKGKAAVMSAILDAATGLFAEKGVAAVSIRDIADNSKGTYRAPSLFCGKWWSLRARLGRRGRLIQILIPVCWLPAGLPWFWACWFSKITYSLAPAWMPDPTVQPRMKF
ncbi:MAG: TetR/AcrR family transcriptional regulator [Desulfobacterales bacterium]|nr:TetR/AcrR family transcriptional regulator [Desulfobacterales bacterium]